MLCVIWAVFIIIIININIIILIGNTENTWEIRKILFLPANLSIKSAWFHINNQNSISFKVFSIWHEIPPH